MGNLLSVSLFVAFSIAVGVLLFFKRIGLVQFAVAAVWGFYLRATTAGPEIADLLSRLLGVK